MVSLNLMIGLLFSVVLMKVITQLSNFGCVFQYVRASSAKDNFKVG
jgi:hypothetical protein